MTTIEQYIEARLEKKKIEEKLELLEEMVFAEVGEAKTVEAMGYKLTIADGRANYSFKNIPQWVDLKEKLSEVEQIAKHDYHTMNLKGTIASVSNDGEVVELMIPTVTYSKPSITLKKA